MVALYESEIRIGSEQPESSEEIQGPPNQQMTVFYRNGTGAEVEEEVTSDSFEESGVVGELKEGIKKLRTEWNRIIHEKRKRKKHGGGRYSEVELAQRRKELAKKETGVKGEIDHKGGMIVELSSHLEFSNPLKPLRLKVSEIAISVLGGEALDEEEKQWWEFMRKRAPEIWSFRETERQEDYELIHSLFIARIGLEIAKGLPIEKEKESQAELDAVTKKVGKLKDKEYAKIHLFINEVNRYIRNN